MIDVPGNWKQIDLQSLRGTVLVLGATDTGKSTLARYLHRELSNHGRASALVDGDPGQSSLGPPTTMSLVIGTTGPGDGAPPQKTVRRFVGSTSPRGHMLPLLVGGARLVQAAYQAGVEVVVYDTTGLVDPGQGGLALKLAKIDLFQPELLVAIQIERELEPLLRPMRRSHRVRLLELKPSQAVTPRQRPDRQRHRAARMAEYFTGSETLSVDWTRFAVLPKPAFRPNRLLALEDMAGFVLGLGIVMEVDRERSRLTLMTPLKSLDGVDTIRLGDLAVDPETYRDQMLF